MLTSDDIRLLGEVGFLAAARGDLARATPIFGALQRLRPTAAFPYVGQAMALLNRGKANEAVTEIERGLRGAESDAMADLHAFRGFALQVAGRVGESQRALRMAGDHPMARALLDAGGGIH